MDMELTKKTTILFSRDLHRRLSRLATQRKTSLGELVRSACEREYLSTSAEDKISAVQRLTALRLPVSDPRRMKIESLTNARKLAP